MNHIRKILWQDLYFGIVSFYEMRCLICHSVEESPEMVKKKQRAGECPLFVFVALN